MQPIEFAKSSPMHACVSAMFMCWCACVSTCFTCQRTKRVPTSHFYVPTFQWMCQGAKPHASFLNISLTKWQGKFLYLKLLYKKLYLISVIHICICILHRNCIILHFYNSCHIKEKCGIFFSFCSLVRNENTKRLVSIRYK